MTKVFIEVRGGLIQNIQSTSEDVSIYVKDYDQKKEPGESDEDVGWQYWDAKGGDLVVSEDEFEDAIVNANN